MRIERAWSLALLAALAAPGRAGVLAETGPLTLALAGPDSVTQTSLPFHLGAPARVWAEAAGVKGLESGRSGEAPEAFLDDQYLGPLLAEHHGSWRSPEALDLGAGDHVLLLRCSSVGIPKPCGLARLRVLSDAPGPPDPPQPAAAAPDCGHPTLSRRWPQRLHGQGLVLSVLSGRSQSAGILARLRPGQAWACRVRLPAPEGRPLPLMAGFTVPQPGRGRLLVSLDRDFHGDAAALGYTPETWEPLTLTLCGGRLSVALAEAPPFQVNYPGPALDLELAAQDVELGLKPALP
ncbi:MAG TPA: hypothetical protein VK842_06410 [bacterium]|nr:hypothetical protein [bacterium]